MRLMFLTCAALPGCILDAEFCGEGFVAEDERCVPRQAAPAWYGDGGPPPVFDAQLRVDAGELDARVAPDVVFVEPDVWSQRKTLLAVDRGTRNSARGTPDTPGYDLDAIGLFAADGSELGYLGALLTAQINDPFGRNVANDPSRAVGPPDAEGFNTDRFVSLGVEGGYVFAALDLVRPLQAGDRVVVFEMGDDGADDVAEIYLCLDEVLSLERCRSLGLVQGTTEVFLAE